MRKLIEIVPDCQPDFNHQAAIIFQGEFKPDGGQDCLVKAQFVGNQSKH